jgi:hypothetical protein
MWKSDSFKDDLKILINKYSVDKYTEMHDFVLAEFLTNMIVEIAKASKEERRLNEN